MHWKGLRLGPSDNSSNRRSVIDLLPQARRSEQLPRPSPPADLEPRHSESAPRQLLGLSQSKSHQDDDPSQREVSDEKEQQGSGMDRTDFASTSTPSLRRNRFSFMRLRHASDPQLSKTYAKDQQEAPPVPSIPPPKIITTAPTTHEQEPPAKQRHKPRLLPTFKKQPMEELSRNSTDQPSVTSRRNNQGSTDSQIADSNLSTSQASTEEPGRLSTTSLRSGGRDQPSQPHRSSATDPRFSESSRSDHSYGDHAIPQTNSPREALAGITSSKRFRLPRLKRNRNPLFPLPAKLPPPAGRGDDASKCSPADTPKIDGDNHDHVTPLFSPSRSSVGLPASGPPPLFRLDDACSVRSNPSTSGRARQGRGRSSTMGSLAENLDDLPPAPNLASSGRTSTSTSGRKSFGDIFSFSQRLRQNSEPPVPHHGSPALGSATPTSKPGSLSLTREMPPCPEREEGDTPATYLTRLEENLPRGLIAGVLCQSDDDFFKVALRKYMRSFSYFGDPVDMSIRKLLMEVELPKETQQIDRFLQSFADRYHECNPGIFASADQAYFIAFSILILHTDVFNKNNKRKMQKPDYVRNTGGEGISEDILECFYENISYTPFIHVEDVNLRDRHLSKPRRTLFKSTSSEQLSRVAREPVDPYAIILDGKLGSLRPSLKDVMDLDDTYNHIGTSGLADMDDLHQAFTKSGILQIVSLRSRPDAFMHPSLHNPSDANPGLVDIKVAKVGMLWRKDPKKKRARSPWQEWGAVLTFSQLYFFRNVTWARSLMAQHDTYVKNGRKGTLVFRPPLTEFKPDAIMSTHDAVALLDSSYKRHKHAFMFVRHNALEEVFLATSEAEMNDWMAKLNYAAAFRTTGVRTKGMIATNYEGQRYRKSQRVDSISSQKSQSTDKEPPSPSIDTNVVAEFVAARRQLMSQKIRETNEKLFVSQKQLDDLLQNARHLQILTPVHSRAREHVIMAAGRMSAKLKWVRQDIWRNKCYRDVLLRDLGEDGELVDGKAGSVADQESANLSPTRLASVSGPSVTSDPSADRAPSVVPTASSNDTTEPAAPSIDQAVLAGSLTQVAAGERRRPSLPASITSAEPARQLSSSGAHKRTNSTGLPASQLERAASVLSRGSKFEGGSLGSRASKMTHASFDDGEERFLRETGLLGLSGSLPALKKEAPTSDMAAASKPEESPEKPQGELLSRTRRSLHRSLRDSHHRRHHSHSKKKQSSVSSIGPLDDELSNDGEVLSRNAPNFTVHGKKASIVTFGPDWQNMPPEERLKLRKPTPSEEPRSLDPAMVGSGDESMMSEQPSSDQPRSMRSASTTTGVSMRSNDEPSAVMDAPDEAAVEDAERPSSPESDSGPGPTLEVSEPEPETQFSTIPRAAPCHAHLTPGDDCSTSASSTSHGERAVDTPSQENLRQQAVGA